MHIILTNCTNRKKGLISHKLSTDNLSSGSIDAVTKQWINYLKKAQATEIAGNVYCGRGFKDANFSAELLNCPLYIVSAGLGIVESVCPIPVYNLTVISGTENSILNKLPKNSSAKDWWLNVTKNNPFGTSLGAVLKQHKSGLILIALSKKYIEILSDELVNLSVREQKRLRFFGKLKSILPATISKNWMPYDDRLDSAGPTYKGIQSDFAQRSLHHFVTEILSKNKKGSLQTHHSMVLKSLHPFKKIETPKRLRLSDEEISKAILKSWKEGKGQSSKLLRIIRRERNIACEQSRFKNIYHSIRKTMGDSSV
jgi:hypothetical protein